MVLTAKIFRVKEYNPLDIIADKIRNYSNVEYVDDVELSYSFNDVKLIGDSLKAYYVFDEARTLNIKGELKVIPVRREALTLFRDIGGDILLVVFEKKNRANRIANTLSEVLFARVGMIVEAYISHEVLRDIHDSSPESSKVIYFDNVDIPNINKLALYGEDVRDTSLYNMYLDHGKIWYVVFSHRDTGLIVGITRNLIVTMFSKISMDDFLDFINKYIIPLI